MSQINFVRNGNGNGNTNGHWQEDFELLGELHAATSVETPLKPDAFDISDEEKMHRIEGHFREIMDILGLDLEDDSLNGTPKRVAKMFVKEIFYGINPKNKPSVSLFDNKFGYKQMLVEKNIRVQSFCEHHFLPIWGWAHVAYIPNGKVIGLSKLNRIVDYYSRRPQVQERLTEQIAKELMDTLETKDVAVYIDAKHMCVQARGIEHQNCSTVTTAYDGRFLNESVRAEFLSTFR